MRVVCAGCVCVACSAFLLVSQADAHQKWVYNGILGIAGKVFSRQPNLLPLIMVNP